MEKDFFVRNRNAYYSKVLDKSISIYFSGHAPHRTADEDYPFVVNRNFYYLTGLKRENFILMMIKSESIKTFLFIEEPSEYASLWLGDRMTKEEAEKISGIEQKNIYYVDSFIPMLHSYLHETRRNSCDIDFLYADLERREYNNEPLQGNIFANDIKQKYPNIEIKNGYKIITKQRMYKTTEEIEHIKKAIDITDKGIKALLKNATNNMFEYELESYYDQVIKANNTEVSFKTIAASGKNATVLHYSINNSNTLENNLILFDLGAVDEVYCSDITRTFPLSGKFTERQKEIYEVVLECNKKSIEFLKPGITFEEFDNFGLNILANGLIKLGIITNKKDVRKYYYHSLGHYLGLDVHDVGEYKTPFKEGIVITVEPGLYIKEEGIGIRIEDDVLITKDGSVNLSKQIIKEVKDIEEYMKKGNN